VSFEDKAQAQAQKAMETVNGTPLFRSFFDGLFEE
jgi:hypothetical protein